VSAGGPLLVVDTATTTAVIALGTPEGALMATRAWVAGYRHGEELLVQVEGLLAEQRVDRRDLGGLIVGTGPGAFTGLRVGIATVKGLAYALGLPVAGVPTGDALLAATRAALASADGAEGRADLVLVQPAGQSDRVLTRPGTPSRILAGGADPELGPGERLVAVDLAGREDEEAVGLGTLAGDGLAEALLAAGSARLRDLGGDDLARLVPEYVTLPRGVLSQPPADGGVAISDDAQSATARTRA
jgi:tRNA threonylcarbamoyl adenosine modification protein YeaZ